MKKKSKKWKINEIPEYMNQNLKMKNLSKKTRMKNEQGVKSEKMNGEWMKREGINGNCINQ